MIYIVKIFIIVFISAFGVTSCNSTPEEVKDTHEEHDDETDVVSLSKMQIEAINLKFVNIKERNLSVGIDVSGELQLEPRDQADISPIIGGVVKSISVFEGDEVKKGQVLLRLEHPAYIELQQDYMNLFNNLKYQKKEFERQEILHKEEIGSDKTFQRTSTEYYNSKSSLEALRLKLAMLNINVREVEKGKIYSTVKLVSPISGVVNYVKTNVGAYINPQSEIISVVNNNAIHADLMVYENDINKVVKGQKMTFITPSFPQQIFEGKIYAISPSFEKDPKAVHIHASIDNPEKSFIRGMYIKGNIIIDDKKSSSLPEDAIVSEGGKSYIFVKINHEDHEDSEKDEHDSHDSNDSDKVSFKKIEIITGINYGGYTEVKLLKTLPNNTQVAANGAYYLLAEMGKAETEHTH